MKAYLINTDERTITEVKYSGDYRDIYELCNFGTFTTVELTEDRDTLYVDDEGLLKGPLTQFFGVLGFAQPLAGNGLILGTNDEGESVAPKHDLQWFKDRLCWVERLTAEHWSIRKANSKAATIVSKISEVERFLGRPL